MIRFDDEFISTRVTTGQYQTDCLRLPAGHDMVGGRIVRLSPPDNLVYADLDIGQFCGMVMNQSVAAGHTATVLPSGIVECRDWTAATDSPKLVPHANYFLLMNGKIGLTLPGETGYLIVVGTALNETTLDLNFKMKVKL